MNIKEQLEQLEQLKQLKELNLQYRTANYEEIQIIKEKYPQLNKPKNDIIIAIFFFILGPAISTFLFYDTSVLLTIIISIIYILLSLFALKKIAKEKHDIKTENFLVITGKCTNKNRIVNRSGEGISIIYLVELTTSENNKIPYLICEKDTFNSININDEIIVVKFKTNYKIIKK